METQSLFDSSRKTVGAIALDSVKNASPGERIEAGAFGADFLASLVEDINECINSNPYDGHGFYITVVEKRDMIIPRAIRRELVTTRFRPFPEADTVVFKVNVEKNRTEFCWCLPQKEYIYNRIANPDLYQPQEIQQLKAFLNEDYRHFGFCKDSRGDWIANPAFEDHLLKMPSKVLSSSNIFTFA